MTCYISYTNFASFGTRPKVAPFNESHRGIIAPLHYLLTTVGTY